MKDFTLDAYKNYILAIKSSYEKIYRFDQLLSCRSFPESFAVIRHDVDRKPVNALKMALLEHSVGIKSTYYFRAKRNTFKPEIIKAIHDFGHEIGYHYESLSDAKGNIHAAIRNFEENLAGFRKIVPIRTIAMHGRPLSKWNNRELWRPADRRKMIIEKFGLLGEVYLDIDYTNIAYICDTGRNWSSGKSNIRDTVETNIMPELRNGNDLLSSLKKRRWKKLVFQIHPERWSDTPTEYIIQYAKDITANIIKKILSSVR